MERKVEGSRCYLLIGEAPTEEAARRIAEAYSGCPFVYFIGAFGVMVVGIFYMPRWRDWWLQAISANPQVTLGLRKAAVYVTESPAFPAYMEPRVPEEKGERSPCGADCSECVRYLKECPGCPASTLFRHDFFDGDEGDKSARESLPGGGTS